MQSQCEGVNQSEIGTTKNTNCGGNGGVCDVEGGESKSETVPTEFYPTTSTQIESPSVEVLILESQSVQYYDNVKTKNNENGLMDLGPPKDVITTKSSTPINIQSPKNQQVQHAEEDEVV